MNETTGPVAAGERIGALDSLRGFALLGILVMNIQSFSMPVLTYVNPTLYGDWTGANYLVWLLSHVLFDQKMMNLFSLLFGAGIILMTDRCVQTGRSPLWLHYRRIAILFVVGMVHAYAFWYGDILVTYALCGMVVYWFHRMGAGWLIGLGLASLAVCSGVHAWTAMGLDAMSPEEYSKWVMFSWEYDPEMKAAELVAFQGGWIDQMPMRAMMAFYYQIIYNITEAGIFRPLGMMLIGMGLFRSGFFEMRWGLHRYIRFSTVMLVPGLMMIVYGVMDNHEAGWSAINYYSDGLQYNYWGAVLVALGYASAMMAIVSYGCLPGMQRVFANVGQMAFTNYLAQTLICTLIFYGHGLGWFGQVERVGQIGVVLFVWALILVWSPLWLKTFRFGPLEWAWRCLTYGKRFAIRR